MLQPAYEAPLPIINDVVVGTVEERLAALKAPADLYIINR